MKCHNCKYVDITYPEPEHTYMTVCSKGHWKDFGPPPGRDKFNAIHFDFVVE